jgi:hypothetical protein
MYVVVDYGRVQRASRVERLLPFVPPCYPSTMQTNGHPKHVQVIRYELRVSIAHEKLEQFIVHDGGIPKVILAFHGHGRGSVSAATSRNSSGPIGPVRLSGSLKFLLLLLLLLLLLKLKLLLQVNGGLDAR